MTSTITAPAPVVDHPQWCDRRYCTTNTLGTEHRSTPSSHVTCDDDWQYQLHRFDDHDHPVQVGDTELHVHVISMVDVDLPHTHLVLRMEDAQRVAGQLTTEVVRDRFLSALAVAS